MLNVEPFKAWEGRTARVESEVSLIQAERISALLDDSTLLHHGVELPNYRYAILFGDKTLQSELADDGHAKKGDFIPPIPLPRRMFAGRRVEFLRPLHIGEKVHRVSTIKSIVAKTGRTGQLCFVTLLHEIHGSQGIAIVEEQDVVYREASGANADRKSEPSDKPVYIPQHDEYITKVVVPDEIMLFRYSAVTFNGHRIHFDKPYATSVEGYPGLVVNGGLIILHMWHFVAEQGYQIKRSASKNLGSLFCGDSLVMHLARNAAGSCRLTATNQMGHLVAEADLEVM